MSKVLISFLGVGDAGSRLYQSVTYKFIKDGGSVTHSFISLAIKEHYDINKMIIIGTKGSVWENFYNTLTHKEDKIYDYLRETCSNYTLYDELEQKTLTEPSIVHQTDIEIAMGEGSKVVIINYGCNEAAQLYNAERIMDIESSLDYNDEVYVDITHSFRSLPMYIMNCLIYIQRIKNVNISEILYGMRDPSLDYVPVVELNSALDIYDWISGIDATMNYGNGYGICEKLESSGSIEDLYAAENIADYSDVFNVNSISNIKEVVSRIKDLDISQMENKMGQLALRMIKDECNNLDEKSNEKKSSYLLQISKMQFNRSNYGTAFLAYKEAIIYYVEECNYPETTDIEIKEERSKNITSAIKRCVNQQGVKDKYSRWWSITDFDNEETKMVKNCLKGKDDLIYCFCKINDYRNGIAHLKESNVSFVEMIKDLDEALDVASDYLS